MTSVLFCTPCYGGFVHTAHFRSCLQLKEDLVRFGVEHDWLTATNESLVTRARNEMTASFLGTKHTHLFWLDADIEFTPQDAADVWNMGADIGVGVYAMKKRDKQWFACWKDGKLVHDLDQYGDGPIEVDFAGTGFMCIKRQVIEKLAEKAPHYQGPHGRVPAVYLTPVYNDGFESEDYHFCRKARESGFKVLMHPKVRLKHWGQYAYGAAPNA